MNYSENMPDWHQFNASQTNEVTQSTQNVNSGHLAFIPGVSPPTLNALSLTSDGLNKHQADSNFNPRSFQSLNNVPNGPNIPNNSPLTSMVQMQNCIGHYASSNVRNPVLDNLNNSVDPRNSTLGIINNDLGYRNNQVPFNGPIGHLSGPNCNLNASSRPGSGSGSRTNSGPGPGTNIGTGTAPGPMFGPGLRHGPVAAPGPGSAPVNMGPRNTSMGSVSAGKPGPPSFVSCKGLCCNSDPNINYQQWEKFGSYQNNTSYRDNVHPSSYQMENRHFGNNCNFRKDNLEGKDVMGPALPNAAAMDHRRNLSDYKHHKDHLVHRNYSTSSGMYHNYPMQNYNYSTEHQKYPYPVKEHPKTNNMNISNTGIHKHQEQNFIAQQKFNNTQYQYQSGNMLPKGVPSLNVNTNMASSMQNPYFNSQYPRNVPTEMSHECHETDSTTMVNRMPNTFMHNSPAQHQVYQHKITMQKFSMENHLREFSKIPGYQSHPKYKECVLRYRELLKLQQSVGYQNPVQQTARVGTPVSNTVLPINLQFDQNGMLINTNYVADNFSKLQHVPAAEQSSENVEKQNKSQTIPMVNEKRAEQLIIPSHSEHVPSSCAENPLQKQSQFSMHKDFNQNQLKVQTNESHNFDTLSTDATNKTMIQHKSSKEFANKPDLDVRQFLANWDETDDEEGTVSNLPSNVLNGTTPVVVVRYENVDISSKISQNTETANRNNFCSNETSLNNEKEGETNVIAAQDCLTISYSSESAEITKTPKQTVREGVVKPGSIIHCISNGPDEIPTIHIVDNLEISTILGASNSQVIETIDKDKAISFFKERTKNETETVALDNTDQRGKNETHLSDNYETPLNTANKNVNVDDCNISGTIQTTVVSMNNQELRVLSASRKNNLDVSENLELKKQSSFASEESHNPDDISLPDLPTSECTPISTTLNTPIHSDSEEPSENIEDLSISTNPIEVMQNSPVISFTQSPVTMEPYGQLNDEDKLKNRSLGMLELEFEKDNCYKNNEANNDNEQDENLYNFDFSAGSPKTKSGDNTKGKLIKTMGNSSVKKKVFLVDDKENDAAISETCAALRSIEYELEVEQDTVEGDKRSECVSSAHEEKYKSLKKSVIQSSDSTSIDAIAVSTASNANLSSPAESDDETRISKHDEELPKRQKIQNLNISINTVSAGQSEYDLNSERKIREKENAWEDKYIEKYLGKNLDTGKATKFRRKDVEHLKQSKKFPDDDPSSSKSGEHFVCHMTSEYKNYSVAVIKDDVALNDKRNAGIAGLSREKTPEAQSKANNTKEFSEEAEIRKHVSNKITPPSHESVHSQSSKKSELLQKDLKVIDGDVKCRTEEMRLLKEYRKRKDSRDERMRSKGCTNQKEKDDQTDCSQTRQNNESLTVYKVCLEQNVSSIVNMSSENSDTSDELKRHEHSKSFGKATNSDFGIQVANVNFKIKDNDTGKELNLRDKSQERMKDSLEGIKIEINVSCTDRNSKGQEQSKCLLFENFKNTDNRHTYEIDDCFDNTADSSKIFGKSQKVTERFPTIADENDAEQSTAGADTSSVLKKGEKRPLDGKDEVLDIPKETCDLSSDSQALDKILLKSVTNKNTSKTELIEGSSSHDDVDTIKSKCAISNTAVVDANNKILIKAKNMSEDVGEDDFVNAKDVRVARVQKQNFTSSGETSSQRNEEKDVATASQAPKCSRKLPDASLVESGSKSMNSLYALDINFDKSDYRKFSGVSFDQPHLNDVDEFDDGYASKWKKPKIDRVFEDCYMFQSTSGYINPIFSSIDKLGDLHTVPVYTTKDGKISYSPNRRFTYHELMMEARKREGSSSCRKSHYAEAWNNYYNFKVRKLYKKKRHQERKKHEYKDMKYLYERKRSYLDDFSGRNHIKYKDYVHGIKNTNAAWLDHSRMERIYSSSDSDEEFVVRSKNYKKSYPTEAKPTIVSMSSKKEIVADDLDLKDKNKEGTSGDHLGRSKDTSTEKVESIHSGSLDGKNDNEDYRRDNDTTDTLISQINISSGVETCANIKESEMPAESCNVTTESQQSTDECNLNTRETEKNNDVSEQREKISTEVQSVNSKMLDETLSLNENERCFVNHASQEKSGNNEGNVSKETVCKEVEDDDVKIDTSNNQTVDLQIGNNFENTDCIESCKNSEMNLFEKSGSEINEIEYPLTKDISEFREDAGDKVEQISEASSKIEEFNDPPNEVIKEEAAKMDINETNENSKCEQESIQSSERVPKLNEEQMHEENDSKKTEESIESWRLENNLSKDYTKANDEFSVINQKELESQTAQTIETRDERNGSECVAIETIKKEEGTKDSEPVDYVKINQDEGLAPTDTLRMENDNNIEEKNLAKSDKNQMETALENIDETPTENITAPPGNLKENSNESDPDGLQSLLEPKPNLSRDSSIEKDMPVLSMYCTIKNSPIDSIEVKGDETVEQKETGSNLSSPESHEGVEHLSDSNKDVKVVPKLVIKKTDTLSTKPECSLKYTEPDNSANRSDAKLTPDVRPKIPKMIIVKNRSRSATPTAEIVEKTKCERTQSLLSEYSTNTDVDNSDSEPYILKHNDYETKVPKVRIKLEDISSKDLKLYLKRKAAKSIPKVRITKIKLPLSGQEDRPTKYETDDNSEMDLTDSEEDDTEKISKLKLRRREEEVDLLQDRIEGRCTSVTRTFAKRSRKPREENTKYDNLAINSEEIKKKCSKSITEKIPKVIIKRTQIGAEFKCEISKSKQSSVLQTSKWQPTVKLQRLLTLDHMVKDLKQSRISLNGNDTGTNVKLFRSNSASSLSPVKCKQRRLSDPDYIKIGTKSVSVLHDDNFDLKLREDKQKSSHVESKNLRRKGKKRLFSQSRHNLMDYSEDEIKESVSITNTTFSNIPSNEDNDLTVAGKEYSFFKTKANMSITNDKTLERGIVHSHNFDDIDNSIIKVESSDESQTTIEILPASPGTSDDEAKTCEGKNPNILHMEDAMPTQLELELELMDNKGIQHSDTFTPKMNERFADEGSTRTYFTEFQQTSQSNSFDQKEYTCNQNERIENPGKKDYFYRDDLLIKEVLAAKETLKKCLARSENEITEKNNPRPKTVAEKKQGLSFNFNEFGRSPSKSEDVHDNEKYDNATMRKSMEKKEYKFTHKLDEEAKCSDENNLSSTRKKLKMDSSDGTSCLMDCPTASTCDYNSVPESTIISLKATKKFGRIMTSEASSNMESFDVPNRHNNMYDVEVSNEEKSENKWTNNTINQKTDNTSETKPKEDNMPLLVPETALNFDSSSDRESSRSPPVITNQEDADNVIEDVKHVENKVINPVEKGDEKKHSYKDCEMTIADIITQLAYPEKATINHRRYCNLCERWFPTTSRHRRHLAGYQHRYMELTQRKSIHALFILFTGKPCSRLLPANVIRNDCSIGELTPLQIAVQDIAKCAEHTQQNLKKKE